MTNMRTRQPGLALINSTALKAEFAEFS